MSTAPLTQLWTAGFSDGHVIKQTPEDRYSKHDDSAEWNPSAFRDVLEYPSEVEWFSLGDWTVNLTIGVFYYAGEGSPDQEIPTEETPLRNRKLIYFREMRKEWIDGAEQDAYINRYVMGYEGKNSDGLNEQKVISIRG